MKPPRIYGGVQVNPKVDWMDVGLTVLSFIPLGRVFTVGGKVLGKAVKAVKFYRSYKKNAGPTNQGTTYSGKLTNIFFILKLNFTHELKNSWHLRRFEKAERTGNARTSLIYECLQ